MANYNELVRFLRDREEVRILILDNNNIQFCNQHEEYFSVDYICSDYDLILVPGWVHAEVSHSARRLDYLNRLPKELIILVEEEDYLPLIGYEDERLMKLFKEATRPHQPCQKFFREIESLIGRTGEIPDEWITDFYERGFDIFENTDRKQLRKNAGEISILVLSFLLIHSFPQKIKYVTISTSDMASYDIKHRILDFVDKKQLGVVKFGLAPKLVILDKFFGILYQYDGYNITGSFLQAG